MEIPNAAFHHRLEMTECIEGTWPKKGLDCIIQFFFLLVMCSNPIDAAYAIQ